MGTVVARQKWPGKLGRDLEHDELVGPSREPARAEAVDLGGDGHQGIVGGLIGEVIELRATQPQRHLRR